MSGSEPFRRIAVALNQLKRGRVVRDWVIYGAVAYTFHEEPIETADLDVLVLVGSDADYFERVFPALRELGPMVGDAATFLIYGIPVQVFPAQGNPLWEDTLRGAVRGRIGNVPVKVASREHLIVLALVSYRPGKDWGRIAQLYQKADTRKLYELLRRFDNGERLLHRRLERLLQS